MDRPAFSFVKGEAVCYTVQPAGENPEPTSMHSVGNQCMQMVSRNKYSASRSLALTDWHRIGEEISYTIQINDNSSRHIQCLCLPPGAIIGLSAALAVFFILSCCCWMFSSCETYDYMEEMQERGRVQPVPHRVYVVDDLPR